MPKTILVSINSWSKAKEPYLRRVLDTYAQEYSDYTLTVVLSTNYLFEYTKLPVFYLGIKRDFTTGQDYQGWLHTWNNRGYLLDHYQDYDYVIDADDDVQIPRRAFDYYVKNESLPNDYIAGFLTAETDPTGAKRLITLGPTSLPPIAKTLVLNDSICIVPSNAHSCCFIADRARFSSAVTRGLSRTPIKKSFYTIPEYARSEIYNEYFTKVVGVQDIVSEAAIVNHLPNRHLVWGRAYPTPQDFVLRSEGDTSPIMSATNIKAKIGRVPIPHAPVPPASTPYFKQAVNLGPCKPCGSKRR